MERTGQVNVELRDDDLRVLILTPHGRDAALAERTLARGGLGTHACTDLGQLRASAVKAGAILIAEEALPPLGTENGSGLLEVEPPWSKLPVVVLLSRGRAPHDYRALRSLENRPNVTFLERPVPESNLISALRTAIESRRLQYQIRDALEELETASRRKDEFLATLSHELRNPLSSIRNAVQALRRLGDEPSRDRAQRLHSMIERQTEHLVSLVDDLLELSRITTGKIELKRKDVRLNEIIQQAIEMHETLVTAARHELTVSLVDEPLVVDGDPVRLTQIVANLINNAAKYTPPAGRIDISLNRDAEQAIISVRDNGMGISADILPQVFALFFQASRYAGNPGGGLGIGLALVRSLVELHGGWVAARSDGVGQGSEFIVSLPLAIPRPDALQGHSEKPVMAPARILVVDDDHDVADSLAMLLQSFGVDVLVAHSGQEALSRLAGFQPQLVLLDIGMPGLDGYETAKRIRAARDGSDIRLVALSGWGGTEDRRRASESGIDLHRTKPITLDAISEILASLGKPLPPAGTDREWQA